MGFHIGVWLTLLGLADAPASVRLATFNIWELGAGKLVQVDGQGRGVNGQLCGAAEIVQRVRPDVLLINEMDFDLARRQSAQTFLDRYLKVSQNGLPPIDYPFVFFGPVNTGIPTGLDLDNDGKTDGPADAYGYGSYPGQYGMALFSKYPIDTDGIRTFQEFLWKDMPNNLMPDGSADKPAWYAPNEVAVFRLSSKSHWDVPLRIGAGLLHVLACHPTPPVFDGPEDRNGRRCFDEIRLWADYLTGGQTAEYLVDDRGHRGGLGPQARFVILGDLNADPHKDAAPYGSPAIAQLLQHPRVQDPGPTGATCDFGRIDYVLPSVMLKTKGSGLFCPGPDDPLHRLVAKKRASSDHRLVWVDVNWP